MNPLTVPPASAEHAPRRTSSAVRASRRRSRVIRRYESDEGSVRELVLREGFAGTSLVIDRDVLTREDQRLVAHLQPDEPAENAMIVSRAYLETHPSRRRCRALVEADLRTVPQPAELDDAPLGWGPDGSPGITGAGFVHRLQLVRARMSILELRWKADALDGTATGQGMLSLREVIARLESYEPALAISRRAISRHRDDPSVSCTVLRTELARVLESPIVLNRGLREAVLARIDREEMSMSEIAIRCGRLKRSSRGRGNESGETSWLARRIGLLPEGGHSVPTPWVHTDVLALIARAGLGISPREVELG
jgi:hypothetical protein